MHLLFRGNRLYVCADRPNITANDVQISISYVLSRMNVSVECRQLQAKAPLRNVYHVSFELIKYSHLDSYLTSKTIKIYVLGNTLFSLGFDIV